MSIYWLLKYLHAFLALISGLGFALRGFIRLVIRRPIDHPLARVGPHIIDTLLLFSGFGLWWLMRFPLASWFGLKLLLVVAYIAVGIAAFRQPRYGPAVLLYLLALSIYLLVAYLALFKPGLSA